MVEVCCRPPQILDIQWGSNEVLSRVIHVARGAEGPRKRGMSKEAEDLMGQATLLYASNKCDKFLLCTFQSWCRLGNEGALAPLSMLAV